MRFPFGFRACEVALACRRQEVKQEAVSRLSERERQIRRSDLGSQSGVAVGTGMARSPDRRHGALGDQLYRFGASHKDQPCRCGFNRRPWITEEGVAVACLMDGGRHNDVAVIAAGIDARTNPADCRGDRARIGKPRMLPASRNHGARVRNGSSFSSSARRVAAPSAPSTSRPETRPRAGRNRDVAFGVGPKPTDGCGISGTLKSARDRRRLAARNAGKHRHPAGGVIESGDD